MLKRFTLILISICMILCICSCNKKDETEKKDIQVSAEVKHTPSGLLGFIVEDNKELSTYEAMHSFICTVDDVDMNSKLYKFSTEDEFNSCVESAIEDNCDAVLFYCKTIDCASGIQKVENKKIQTVSLINKIDAASCSVVLENSDIEILKILADKISEEDSILIYGNNFIDKEKLSEQLNNEGYNVTLKTLVRDEYAYDEAQAAVHSFLVNNTSVKAIYAIGEQNARPAVLAARESDSSITVVGSEISDVNVELFNKGMYALAVSPYYDMTAKAVYIMRKLTDGNECSDEVCTVHFVTKDKLDKYVSIRKSTAEWFGIQG